MVAVPDGASRPPGAVGGGAWLGTSCCVVVVDCCVVAACACSIVASFGKLDIMLLIAVKQMPGFPVLGSSRGETGGSRARGVGASGEYGRRLDVR